MKTEDKKEIYDKLQIILQNRSILFAEWISEKGYDNMFQDIEKNGKTWSSYSDESKRFTIIELYNDFMIEYLCL